MSLGYLKTGGKRVNNISLSKIKHINMLKVQYIYVAWTRSKCGRRNAPSQPNGGCRVQGGTWSTGNSARLGLTLPGQNRRSSGPNIPPTKHPKCVKIPPNMTKWSPLPNQNNPSWASRVGQPMVQDSPSGEEWAAWGASMLGGCATWWGLMEGLPMVQVCPMDEGIAK